MVEKFGLITLLCISLAQTQGNGMEEAIKTALNGVQIIYNGGQAKISGTIQTIDYKTQAIQTKTKELVIKSLREQKKAVQELREVVKAMEQKAQETNKPESVFECIKRNEEKANNKSHNITQKFLDKIASSESKALINIKTESKSLIKMQTELKEKYDATVFIIKNSGTLTSINNAVKNFGKWVDQMNVNIRKILSEVGNITNDHRSFAENLLRNDVNLINQAKFDGMSDIRKCVFPESNIKFISV